jgi:hypothetical protein
MALKLKTLFFLLILPLLLQGLFGFQSRANVPVTGAISDTAIILSQISLKDFASALKSDSSGELKGIYANGKFALRVVQQPAGDAGFVSSIQGVVTQFAMAQKNNVIGLLAHNFSSGSQFTYLQMGGKIDLIYGDGTTKEFTITGVDSYQALSPTSPYSDFVNLATGEKLTAEQMFIKYYTGNPHVTFQTCIQQGDQSSWGRLFIVAQELP